jgi:YegS/Rv2252/BmrU family lipid kinase
VTRRLALLANPLAAGGRSARVLPKVVSELEAIGAPHRVLEAASLDAARAAAEQAARAGETVVAMGGDGLVGPIAGVVRDTPGALAVVPAGRGNDYARVLRIPREPRMAARVAASGEERMLDVAEANGVPFVGIASVGFDSEANRIANEARLVRGGPVYLYAALRALAGWQHASFDVDVDGQRASVTGYSVAVANSKAYGGGMFLVPHAELDDGCLDVLLVGEKPKLGFLRDVAKVFRGTHVQDPAARFLRGKRIVITADRPFDVYADGDPIARLPVEVTVAPRVLRVLTPAPLDAAPPASAARDARAAPGASS